MVLGPTFAPLLGTFAKAAAVWFLMFNMFHDTIAPLSGATRTLLQLSEDGLLPRILMKRTSSDAPSVSTLLMMIVALIFLWGGEPLWIIAAANFTYLSSICLVSVAVWLLRKDQPHLKRPYRAPKGWIEIGLIAASIWAGSILLGFEQFGLPTIITAICFAYAGTILYAWRKMSDRRLQGLPSFKNTIHMKLTGAMLIVLALDGIGYLLAVSHVPGNDIVLITVLEDIFVLIAILTIAVGLVLPDMIAHSVIQVTKVAKKLTSETLTDFSNAMLALGRGDLEAAHTRVDITPIKVHSRDEIGEMALSFNVLQSEIARAAIGLEAARTGLSDSRNKLLLTNQLLAKNESELLKTNETLEEKVLERTSELEKIQQELLIRARYVGMAEVATNVLHNVGNVLNSVNISVESVNIKFINSKINDIQKISNLINEHKNDLPIFLTKDPKGVLLPAYIEKIANYWKNEHAELTAELKELADNVNHIKEIIAKQQSLAGTSSLVQNLDINLLLEDAIKMTRISLEAHKILLQREFQSLPPVIIDKVKLLQLIINLLTNAKAALIASLNPNKILTIRSISNSPDKFSIVVSDNGIGIAPENLPRIFSHGFTTKTRSSSFLSTNSFLPNISYQHDANV
jgi:signal transduction histidine kinase